MTTNTRDKILELAQEAIATRGYSSFSFREIATELGIKSASIHYYFPTKEALYRRVVAPIAVAGTPGAWYRGWRVMSLDGTTLDVADTAENARAFGRPASSRGANATSAFPQQPYLRWWGVQDSNL